MHTYLEDDAHTHFPSEVFDYVIISLVLHEVSDILASHY